jgi:hypothetical protein
MQDFKSDSRLPGKLELPINVDASVLLMDLTEVRASEIFS